jgi:hypothetical protein
MRVRLCSIVMPVRPAAGAELIAGGAMSFPASAGPSRMTFPGRPRPTAIVSLSPPITRADIPVLCDDLAGRLRGRAGGVVICDVAGIVHPDVVTVEALARLRLTALRHGWTMRVHGAGPRLRRLVGFLGLAGALPVEVGRQAEQREQVRGVEEVVDRGDPPA